MALNVRQRQHLKALAHHRKPVVQVGNAGITAAVIKEIELALGRHELLKIRGQCRSGNRAHGGHLSPRGKAAPGAS